MSTVYDWPEIPQPHVGTSSFENKAEYAMDHWSDNGENIENEIITARDSSNTINDRITGIEANSYGKTWIYKSTDSLLEKNSFIVSKEGIVLTLPQYPDAGDFVHITCGGNWFSSPITINPNGHHIEGISASGFKIKKNSGFSLIYANEYWGWAGINFAYDEDTSTSVDHNQPEILGPDNVETNSENTFCARSNVGTTYKWRVGDGSVGELTLDSSYGECVRATAGSFCGQLYLTVTDDKGNAYTKQVGNYTPITWKSSSPQTVTRNASITVSVDNGALPLSWAISGTGFSIVGSSNSRSAIVTAGASACGSAVITCTDACGQSATGYVRCTTGRWLTITPGNICILSGAADTVQYNYPTSGYITSTKTDGKYRLSQYQGYICSGFAKYYNTQNECIAGVTAAAAGSGGCNEQSSCQQNPWYAISPAMACGCLNFITADGFSLYSGTPKNIYTKCVQEGPTSWYARMVVLIHQGNTAEEWKC